MSSAVALLVKGCSGIAKDDHTTDFGVMRLLPFMRQLAFINLKIQPTKVSARDGYAKKRQGAVETSRFGGFSDFVTGIVEFFYSLGSMANC